MDSIKKRLLISIIFAVIIIAILQMTVVSQFSENLVINQVKANLETEKKSLLTIIEANKMNLDMALSSLVSSSGLGFVKQLSLSMQFDMQKKRIKEQNPLIEEFLVLDTNEERGTSFEIKNGKVKMTAQKSFGINKPSVLKLIIDLEMIIDVFRKEINQNIVLVTSGTYNDDGFKIREYNNKKYYSDIIKFEDYLGNQIGTLLIIEDKNKIDSGFFYITVLSTLIIGIISVFLIIIINILINAIVKPIDSIGEALDNIVEGNFEKRLDFGKHSELKEFSEKVNKSFDYIEKETIGNLIDLLLGGVNDSREKSLVAIETLLKFKTNIKEISGLIEKKDYFMAIDCIHKYRPPFGVLRIDKIYSVFVELEEALKEEEDIEKIDRLLAQLKKYANSLSEKMLYKKAIEISFSDTKVLVVDDNEMMLKTIKLVLSENLNLQFVTRGQDASELINSGEIGLVITDINLPDFSGFTLAEKAKDYGCITIGMSAESYEFEDDSFDDFVGKENLTVLNERIFKILGDENV